MVTVKPCRTRHSMVMLSLSLRMHLLPDSGPKLGPQPPDEIAQQCSRLFVVLVSVGCDVPNAHDHSLSRIHRAHLAQQVESRPAVLEAHPGRLAVDHARSLRPELAAPLVQVPGSADEVDRGAELLIAQPALMFSAALEPGTDRDAYQPNQRSTYASQQGSHRHTLAPQTHRRSKSEARVVGRVKRAKHTVSLGIGAFRGSQCPELRSWLSASDCEIPVFTGVNGTLMARRSWTVPGPDGPPTVRFQD